MGLFRVSTPPWPRAVEVFIPPHGQPEASLSVRSARFHVCQAIKWIAPCSLLTLERDPRPLGGEATPPDVLSRAVLEYLPVAGWEWEIRFAIDQPSQKQDQWRIRKAMRKHYCFYLQVCELRTESLAHASLGRGGGGNIYLLSVTFRTIGHNATREEDI